MEFDYRFTTATGYLDVFLNDIFIGTRLETLSIVDDEFLHVVFEVEDPSLLALLGVPLLFQLDGPAGSSILIDNINFPGLLNGDFEQGLDMWKAEGQGIVGTTSPVQAFVTRFYQLCLSRDPDQVGLEGWVDGSLDDRLTGSDVANGFVSSQEFLNKNTMNPNGQSKKGRCLLVLATNTKSFNTFYAVIPKHPGRLLSCWQSFSLC